MLLRENKIDILALNETKICDIVSDALISIDGYNHERCDRNRHGGGVLVYIKNTIAYDRLHESDLVPDHNCIETVTIQIKPKCAKPFAIIAWYRPPNYNTDDILNIERIYRVHDKTNSEIIIMGDLNCDDLPDQDKSSIVAKLRGFYRQYQFRQVIKEPTRTTNRSSTLLDHFATNKPEFITYSGTKTVGFSDHDLIFGMRKISGSMRKDPKVINCRNTKNYTPDLFRKALTEASWDHILSLDDPHDISEKWLDQFTEILDQIAPFKLRKVKSTYAPFIDKDLRQKMLLRDLYKKKHTKNHDPDDWLKYKQIRNEVNAEMKTKRNRYFSQKLEDCHGDIRETWRVLNAAMGRKSKTTVINSLDVNSKTITDPESIAEELNLHFSTIAEKVQAEAETNYNQVPNDKNIDHYLSFIPQKQAPFKFKQITPEMIINCMSKMKNSKSGKIATRFVKDTILITAPMLATIFNKSTQCGTFPNNLKIGKVCPIYKGKGSKSDPDNYRPISVLSVIARLFEKLIHEQLFPYFNDYLYKNQSGFRPKYSTQTALLNTSNQWLLNIDKGDYNIAVFLDLRKAFDTVDHSLLILKLEYYGVLGTELRWFKSYLSGRQQYCSVNNKNSPLTIVRSGIPQGSSLGPLLFLIYINDLPCALENSEPDIYADDTGIFISGNNLKMLEENVNLDLQHVCCWLQANKLSLNAVKCKYMIIGSQYNLSHMNYIPDINILGHKIERVFYVDQLGVTIDDQLKWDKHVDKLCKKLSSALFSMKQVKFLPIASRLTLYRSLVETRLRYCNVVWGNCGTTLINKLQHLQNRAIEIIHSDSEPADLNATFKDLSLLNVQQMIDFNTATTVYDSIHRNCPEYLADMFLPAQQMHNYQTRHAQYGLFPSHINRVAGQRSFSNRGCHLWNSLPHSLKDATTAQCFKTNLFKIITGTG